MVKVAEKEKIFVDFGCLYVCHWKPLIWKFSSGKRTCARPMLYANDMEEDICSCYCGTMYDCIMGVLPPQP
ncbi:Os02g0781800 [Oryza sativa Japonica Group]|jgi:hypothetical protein|uniref:Os02g0781800 protein n=1 Tax=Oryza sativa subsp. japonica TaxID=39947 RepID=A0A0P0VQ95_ORYSJ|nr:hypothetical protein EE612_014064 [Oryza sativa]BAS81228.1 Os02g0781800 [Oryza sativa Japonica Group]